MRRPCEEALDPADEAAEAGGPRLDPHDARRAERAAQVEGCQVEEHAADDGDDHEGHRIDDGGDQDQVPPERAQRDQQQREVVHQVEGEGDADQGAGAEHPQRHQAEPDGSLLLARQ